MRCVSAEVLTQQLSVGVSPLLISILMDLTVSFQSRVFIYFRYYFFPFFFCILLGDTCCHVFQPLAKKVLGHLMEAGGGGGGVTNVMFFL